MHSPGTGVPTLSPSSRRSVDPVSHIAADVTVDHGGRAGHTERHDTGETAGVGGGGRPQVGVDQHLESSAVCIDRRGDVGGINRTMGTDEGLRTLVASMSTPSPTYARTVPLSTATGSNTVTSTTEMLSAFLTSGVAVITASASTVSAPVRSSTARLALGTVPAAEPTWASTTPLTVAVTAAALADSAEIDISQLVASAS